MCIHAINIISSLVSSKFICGVVVKLDQLCLHGIQFRLCSFTLWVWSRVPSGVVCIRAGDDRGGAVDGQVWRGCGLHSQAAPPQAGMGYLGP